MTLKSGKKIVLVKYVVQANIKTKNTKLIVKTAPEKNTKTPMVALSVSTVVTEDTQTRTHDQAAALVPIHASKSTKGPLLVATVLRDITSHPEGKDIVNPVKRDNIGIVLDMGAKTAPRGITNLLINKTHVKIVAAYILITLGQVAPTG